MSRLAIFILCFVIAHFTFAQTDIPIGTWRTHFSYYNIKHVAEAGSRIYASAESGLYFFDKEDNSITKITKTDGLQADDISTLYFDAQSSQLLIGYSSGNLDVIRGNEIFNFDLISTSQVAGSKKINHIIGFQSNAFIATDYGILKFDLDKLEVAETYRELGLGAKPIKVNQGTIYNDSLFIATDEGILAANLIENINLLDYQNWKRFDLNDGIPDTSIAIIATINNMVVAGINEDQLYKYQSSWTPTGVLTGADFGNATTTGAQLLIVHDNTLSLLSPALEVMTVQDDLFTELNAAISDAHDNLWIADAANGLISNYQGDFQSYTLDGPYRNDIFRFVQHENAIYAFPGGYTTGVTPLGNESGFYVYQQNNWQNYNSTGVDNVIPEVKDIVDGAYHQGLGNLFVSSIGYGLLQITDAGETKILNETNSPLENLSASERRVLVPAVARGGGGLWVLNYGANNPLHFLDKDGNWRSYSFNLTAAQYPLDVMTVSDQVWIITDPGIAGGILVFEPDTERYRFLSDVANNGGLASANVNDFALDKEGLVWIGTDNGISVFTQPSQVLEGNVDAIEPIFGGALLFKEEKVLSIEIDGGNRKWIGTTKGVWLLNDAADEQLLQFNKNNSPLPDNAVLDIEINPSTGEVFFATAKGIVSYRGTATEAEPVHSKVKIFPNPITADFKGTVGISGLAENAIVKITDTAGRLIWQTEANGGTATWGVSDYNGNRADSGVYLVFSASPDGEDTFVGKIAVIN